MPPGEDIVHIDAVSGSIGYLQVRGESSDVTDPPVRFAGRGYRVNELLSGPAHHHHRWRQYRPVRSSAYSLHADG